MDKYTTDKFFCTLVAALLSFLFLTSCATKQTTTPTETNQVKIPSSTEHIQSVEMLLAEIGSEPDPTRAAEKLINATDIAIKQNKFKQALYIASQLKELELTSNTQSKNLFNLSRILLHYQQVRLAQDLLATIDKQFISPSQYYRHLANLTQHTNNSISSIEALMTLQAHAPDTDGVIVDEIWQNLSNLTPWQLTQLRKTQVDGIKGWLALIDLAASGKLDETNLSNWANKYASHPAIQLISKIGLADYSSLPAENIAVLLPLSGREESLGQIVQQGLISAYQNQEDATLTFYDTNKHSIESIYGQLSTTQTDFIIGPLLKRHVATFTEFRTALNSANNNTETSETPIPALILNSTSTVDEFSYSYSLRPEDEAIQAAEVLSLHGYENPIVISHESKVGKRVANAFTERWQELTARKPLVVMYQAADKMQGVVEEILDVSLSKKRFEALDKRINEKVFDLSRNRRDIDMIYLFGNSTQTRLLKPFIDVNISPFADTIPIFGTSRSHSSQEDRNISRDLVGLTFTDMPWLIPAANPHKAQKKVIDEIWPNRRDNLQRLFAMGHDSYQLAKHLHEMKQNPFLRIKGQTGLLTLSNDNVVKRTLVWGKYRKGRVVKVAMD